VVEQARRPTQQSQQRQQLAAASNFVSRREWERHGHGQSLIIDQLCFDCDLQGAAEEAATAKVRVVAAHGWRLVGALHRGLLR
jgi:hypothetical protein